jgi:hypothetical protein
LAAEVGVTLADNQPGVLSFLIARLRDPYLSISAKSRRGFTMIGKDITITLPGAKLLMPQASQLEEKKQYYG